MRSEEGRESGRTSCYYTSRCFASSVHGTLTCASASAYFREIKRWRECVRVSRLCSLLVRKVCQGWRAGLHRVMMMMVMRSAQDACNQCYWINLYCLRLFLARLLHIYIILDPLCPTMYTRLIIALNILATFRIQFNYKDVLIK